MQPLGCINETWYEINTVGSKKYESIGATQGKYNASPSTGTLTYQVTTTTSKSTTTSVGASMTAGWAILQVEARLGYDVTDSTSSSVALTDTLQVPGYRYGYQQPKIERTTFAFYRHQIGSACSESVTFLGYLNAITSYPFWSSCISTGPCTPKP
jgi:hypothetical protein